jgi:hypothetical protein
MTITNVNGEVIGRITGPSEEGFHRVAWNLRYPSVDPVALQEDSSQASSGPLVLPGRYKVTLSKLLNGIEKPIGESQTFEVVALGGSTLQVQDPLEVLKFQRETSELLRRALGAQEVLSDTSRRLQHIRKALILTPSASSDLFERTLRLESELADLKELLEGDPIRQSLSEPTLPGIIGRLRQIVRGHWESTYGPTQTHRRNYEIANHSFESFHTLMKDLVQEQLIRLERELEAARAPHTPGRSVP